MWSQVKGVRYLYLLSVIFLLAAGLTCFADAPEKKSQESFDYSAFRNLPVLQEGRVKPLDTFARTYLKIIYGRDSLPDAEAIEWLAELVFSPERATERSIFNIPYPDVVNALQLEWREGHRYSHQELIKAFRNNSKTIKSLYSKPEPELSLAQQKILGLYESVAAFEDISRSLIFVMPIFSVKDKQLAKALEVEPNSALDYMTIRKKKEIIDRKAGGSLKAEKVENKAKSKVTVAGISDLKSTSGPVRTNKKLSPTVSEAKILQQLIQLVEMQMNSQSLAVVPPQWGDMPNNWLSLWRVSFEGYGSPDSAKLLVFWKEMAGAYNNGSPEEWKEVTNKALKFTLDMPYNNTSKFRLNLEILFHKFAPFTIALCLYALTFILVVAAPRLIKRPRELWLSSVYAMSFGVIAHGAGLLMRMIIMGRPPVSSLYESIIFVSFVSVFWGLFIEWKRRDSFGLMASSLLGSVLLFVGRRYEMEGDTMKVLVAVLDTNFWLGTHVVAITIGYASTIACCAIAHLYLFQRVFKPNSRGIQVELYNNLRGVGLVAIFFTALGTILGGIWADQSWGRFWGWDPKENGALLIVLWLAWVIHGRISGQLKELGVVMGMAAGGIMVSLAWFGVNLLNVGLHSYGFTSGEAFNLGSFIATELLIIFGSYFIIRRKISKEA